MIETKHKEMAAVFKALAHPTRLFLLEKIIKENLCVCELRDLLDVDISTVSRHLTILKHAGLIYDEKKGNMVFYKPTCTCIENFFDCVQTFISVKLNDDIQNLKKR